MLPPDFITSLTLPDPAELVTWLKSAPRVPGGCLLELKNELRPSDIFCYLHARFGAPNGLLSKLRKDDSDNLIHWEWTLRTKTGLASFQGHNFRTEVHVPGGLGCEPGDAGALVAQFRACFGAEGEAMSAVRRQLEPWTEFVNPYQRIRRSVDGLLKDLDSLKLDATSTLEDPFIVHDETEQAKAVKAWEDASSRYLKGFGLCFGIRSMLPVLAESFVNFLIFSLLRPHIRNDARLSESVVRQPIDVRIKSLSTNCSGFIRHPDYAHDACRKYHTLVNERNDLLHGNWVVDKLKFNEVYFMGKVPVFKEYRSVWQRSLGVDVTAFGLAVVREEMAVVNALIDYLLSCLDPNVRKQTEYAAERFELGINTKTMRLGVLFPPWLSDVRIARGPTPPSAKPADPAAQQGAAADDRPQAGDRSSAP